MKILVEQKIAQERYNICKECEFILNHSSKCTKCNCIMKDQVKLTNFGCPEGKWEKIDGNA